MAGLIQPRAWGVGLNEKQKMYVKGVMAHTSPSLVTDALDETVK